MHRDLLHEVEASAEAERRWGRASTETKRMFKVGPDLWLQIRCLSVRKSAEGDRMQRLRLAPACGWLIGAIIIAFGRWSEGAEANSLPPPVIRPAVDGILEAFKTHPLVGVGDYHGLAQEADFYVALIRDPRFARDVGNVVVEFGGAAHQGTIDRYLNGETIPYSELRKVWTDVVGWIPAVTSLGYVNFYAQVRAVNLTLPPDQRIRVWLGEPPIDWSKINSREDLGKPMMLRDRYPADLIEKEILAKSKKALLIYGHFHMAPPAPFAPVPPPGLPPFGKNITETIKQFHSNAFFVVVPYVGYYEGSCSAGFERKIRGWPIPALVTPVRGTSLETELRRVGCQVFGPGSNTFAGNLSETQKAQNLVHMEEVELGIAVDGLLYLGPAATLTYAPSAPDIYLDAEYRREMERRYRIMIGKPLDSNIDLLTPQPVRP
jgi:hypothetical protein